MTTVSRKRVQVKGHSKIAPAWFWPNTYDVDGVRWTIGPEPTGNHDVDELADWDAAGLGCPKIVQKPPYDVNAALLEKAILDTAVAEKIAQERFYAHEE